MSKKEKKEIKSALNVNDGIVQPSSLSNQSIEKLKNSKRPELSIDDYLKGILRSDITILSKAITIIESNKKEHFDTARAIIDKCLPYSGNSVRLGITGIPGAGKSTFIEAFGNKLLEQGKKIAVLAVDPSSEKSKGSILGDKTRMESLSQKENVYIRPTPSSGSLGGVARKTRETILLCEAAGFDLIIIETVGVGQSETMVKSMVDFFILLMIAGAGDELQGVKRGIMEMANLILINKADGDNIKRAEQALIDIENSLHYFPVDKSSWIPKVYKISSLNKTGLSEVQQTIDNYCKITNKNSYFKENRNNQSIYWMHQILKESILQDFYNDPLIIENLQQVEKLINNNRISSYDAAYKLLNKCSIKT